MYEIMSFTVASHNVGKLWIVHESDLETRVGCDLLMEERRENLFIQKTKLNMMKNADSNIYIVIEKLEVMMTESVVRQISQLIEFHRLCIDARLLRQNLSTFFARLQNLQHSP